MYLSLSVFRLILASILFVYLYSCGDTKRATDNIDIYKNRGQIVSPKLKPIQLLDTVEQNIKNWTAFYNVKQSILDIETPVSMLKDTLSRKKQLLEGRSYNSFQTLYYMIYALEEQVLKLKKSAFPDKLRTSSIISRIGLLHTYVLRLKLDMEIKPFPDNESITNQLDDIFYIYNSILLESNRIFTEVINENTIRALSIPPDSITN